MNYVIIVAGPSAVGKTTIINRLIEENSQFEYVRSATTRDRRGDGNDAEYIYVSESEFLLYIKDGQMLEYTNYAGKYYGTPRNEIQRIIDDGKTPVLILDIQGVKSLKAAKLPFSCVALYLYDDIDKITKRLEARMKTSTNDNAEQIFKKRCEQNRADYLTMPDNAMYFDAFIKNLGVEQSSRKILEATEKITNFGIDAEENLKIANMLKKSVLQYKKQAE